MQLECPLPASHDMKVIKFRYAGKTLLLEVIQQSTNGTEKDDICYCRLPGIGETR